jgi:AraC-like DNA-binding protein
VRDSLRDRPEWRVTRTALAFGFAHLGRFSASYRRMFGETPSETLRRVRRG